MTKALKMMAQNLEDMSVLSSLCQDALISVADISYSQEQKSFVAVLNRFCWDQVQEGDRDYFRSHSGLRFDNVTAVAYKGLSKQNTDQILSLLTIAFAPDKDDQLDGAGFVMLQFADDKAIRLTVSNVSAVIEDLGERWGTAWLPGHENT
ncbi:DUF2948 family protein [Curvivirga aplysinae]|uniref:DUF2948 family protein n=1 Tax=Curvivirga aplysinae TaxID=2529852 RepID=UPI001C3F5BCA|nr:DUF2948 family protein [Curvivirga aplysinae]